MRITNGMLTNNMMSNLNSNLHRLSKYQEQGSSGRKFNKPSDDPIGMSKSLKLYTDISKVEQYERNLRDANSWMHSTENALIEFNDIIQRARELTVDMANGTKTEKDTKNAAEEMKQLKEQVIKLANSRHAGRSIFTGFKTDQDLLDEDGNYIIDVNSKDVSIYNVGISESMDINTVGMKIFGAIGRDNTDSVTDKANKYDFGFGEAKGETKIVQVGNPGDLDYVAPVVGHKSSVIEMFDQLIDAYGGGDNIGDFDQQKIGDMLGAFDTVHENSLAVRAEIGAKTNRLDMTEKRLTSERLNFKEVLSNNEDVDYAELIMHTKLAENVYNASLSIGSRIIQPTLVDFLR